MNANLLKIEMGIILYHLLRQIRCNKAAFLQIGQVDKKLNPEIFLSSAYSESLKIVRFYNATENIAMVKAFECIIFKRLFSAGSYHFCYCKFLRCPLKFF